MPFIHKMVKKGFLKKTEKEIKEIADRTIRVMNPLDKKAQLIDTHFKPILKPFKPDKRKLTFGQKTSDWLTEWAGSWIFITGFWVFLVFWMALNSYIWFNYFQGKPFDP